MTNCDTNAFTHETVLPLELTNGLNLQPGDIAIDCTSGGGGHTQLLLHAVGPSGAIIALDQDDQALAHLEKRFTNEISSNQLVLQKANFDSLIDIVRSLDLPKPVAGIAADLGVSSHQLDTADRGFSFRYDGPLDMRMDTSPQQQTVAQYLEDVELEELTSVIRDFGEEPQSYRIAKAILFEQQREPIVTTGRLAAIVESAIRYKSKSKKHPATKTFQALRIKVNRELECLESLITDSIKVLGSEGRLGIISFHSLEDRIVKHTFKKLSTPAKKYPRGLPITEEVERVHVPAKIIKPFPIFPSDEEINKNPRSRSAKLRILQKVKEI